MLPTRPAMASERMPRASVRFRLLRRRDNPLDSTELGFRVTANPQSRRAMVRRSTSLDAVRIRQGKSATDARDLDCFTITIGWSFWSAGKRLYGATALDFLGRHCGLAIRCLDEVCAPECGSIFCYGLAERADFRLNQVDSVPADWKRVASCILWLDRASSECRQDFLPAMT